MSNQRVNPTHSVGAALANRRKRRAAGRAGYAQRSADKGMGLQCRS